MSTGSKLSGTEAGAQLDPRRRKLLFRSWHRGMKEMDLIFGQYADQHIATMDEDTLNEFERLLEVLDPDLFKWITGEDKTPEAFDTILFRDLILFRDKIDY